MLCVLIYFGHFVANFSFDHFFHLVLQKVSIISGTLRAVFFALILGLLLLNVCGAYDANVTTALAFLALISISCRWSFGSCAAGSRQIFAIIE